MSITISNDLQVHILSLGAGQSNSFKLLTPENAPESFAILRSYLSPLEGSKVSSDKEHYRTMVQSIDHFNQTEKDDNRVTFSSQEISNWQALNLVSSLWDRLGIAKLGDLKSSSQDLTQRIRIEDAFLRVFSNYGIANTYFFKGQEHFSITRGDARKLSRSLGQAINEGRPSSVRHPVDTTMLVKY